MSIKPKTIDNLGVDSSSRYAKDQATIDRKFLEDARNIPLKTEISVLKPYLPTEFEHYLSSGKTVLWSAFDEPPIPSHTNLFSHELSPSLGGAQKMKTNTDKLEAMEETITRSFKEGKQDHLSFQNTEKERKIVLSLVTTVRSLNRLLTTTNARRNQLQRG